MLIYNVFPLLAGKFSDWNVHIDRAADMGFDWIFVNPVHKPGKSGSLYSVADYFQLNPLLVDPDSPKSPEQQLKDANREAARKGMGMMIDLVISHCAVDSELTRQHPEWFLRGQDGRIAHPFCMEDGKKVEWRDLAQFDHRHTSDPEGLYGFLAEVTEYLVGLGYTGFRCDAAYQIPRDLWQRLIRDVKQRHPDVVFTAETLGCTSEQTKATAQAGFDYVFNSSKWWDFHSPWLLEQYQLVREITPSISFPESHDTERLYHETQGNLAAVKQRYLFAALFSAGVMMPIGFEFGFRKRLHVVKTRPEDWETTDIDLQEFIREVNEVKRRYRVFQEESPTTILPYENPDILLLWKAFPKAQEEALIILNKDPWNHQQFHVDDLQAYVQAGTPLMDVSPEYPMEYIATQPFSYDLRPGQGLVLVTAED